MLYYFCQLFIVYNYSNSCDLNSVNTVSIASSRGTFPSQQMEMAVGVTHEQQVPVDLTGENLAGCSGVFMFIIHINGTVKAVG